MTSFVSMKDLIGRRLRKHGAGTKIGDALHLEDRPSRSRWRKIFSSSQGKIREAVIAYELEKKLSKQRILELYLNVIEWGDGIYGAQAAAQVYFVKSAATLTLAEAIRLALLLPDPRRYSPVRDTGKWMNEQRRTVAERMLKSGWLSEEEEYECIMAELNL